MLSPDPSKEKQSLQENPTEKRESYATLGAEIGELVEEKQLAYGDSFGRSGECLRQMFPNGITPDQYDDVLTIARILDKLFRIATNPDAFGESPYKDITGYGLLGYGKHKLRQGTKNNDSTGIEEQSQ